MRTFNFVLILTSLLALCPNRIVGQSPYQGQEVSVLDSLDVKTSVLSLNLLGEAFYRNNEYSASVIDDYTLPGYRCLAYLTYTPKISQKVSLKLGVEHMYFWGASKYPTGIAYKDLPYWSSMGDDYSRFRIFPYFQAAIALNKNWAVILGNIEGGSKHGLIEALYNPELNLSGDSERGAEIKYRGKHTKAELWVDWQSFIFNRDKHQEAFFVGLNLEGRFAQKSNSSWAYSLQALTGHRGGKVNIVPDTVHTWLNAALGLKYDQGLSLFNQNLKLQSSLYALGYSQRGGHFPRDKGWGLFSDTQLNYKQFYLGFSMFYGANFLSPLGTPFVQSLKSYDELSQKILDNKLKPSEFVLDDEAKKLLEDYYGRKIESEVTLRHQLTAEETTALNYTYKAAYLKLSGAYTIIKKRDYSLGLSAAMWFSPLLRNKTSSYIELYLSISPHIKIF